MRTQDTFLAFWNENQEFSSVDRRKSAAIANPKLHPGIRVGRVQQAEEEGNIRQGPASTQPGLRFTLSVYRRARIYHRAFFEHFGFPLSEKIWLFLSGSLIPWRRFS